MYNNLILKMLRRMENVVGVKYLVPTCTNKHSLPAQKNLGRENLGQETLLHGDSCIEQ